MTRRAATGARLYLALFCLSAASFPGTVSGQSTTLATGGTSAFDFLKVSPVARAMGAGGAYTALGDDVGSIAYNPAGLASILTYELDLTYMTLYQDFNYGFAAYAVPVGAAFPSVGGTVAMSAVVLQPGSMPRTDDVGNNLGTFTNNYGVFTLAYARAFGPNIQIGVSGKYIYQQIDTLNTSTIALDTGIVIMPFMKDFRVGIDLKNLGGQTAGFDLPLDFNVGVSYRKYEIFSPQDDGALTADETAPVRPVGEKIRYRLGGEYNYKWRGSRATLRAGVNNDGVGLSPTVGAGYGMDVGGVYLFLDYAFAPQDLFGSGHRVSITAKF